MAVFLTIVLLLSCVAMAGLLYAKHWELTTGRILFEDKRPQMADFSHRMLVMFETHLPALLQDYRRRALVWLRGSARAGLAHALLAIEQWLERTLHTLRHKITPPSGATGQASAFLREVAEHKKRLSRRIRKEFPPFEG